MSTTSDHHIRPAAAFLRLAALALVAAAAVLAIGYLPTKALAGPAGINGMLAGVGIALLGTLAGIVPAALLLNQGPRGRLSGVLAGTAVRFVFTLSLLLAALLSGRLAKVPLALWVAIAYMVLLAADTAGVIWLMKRAERAST